MLETERQSPRVAVQLNSGSQEQYDTGYREWLVYAVREVERRLELEVKSTLKLFSGTFTTLSRRSISSRNRMN